MADELMIQGELIPSTEMPARLFETRESKGQYTAARLFKNNPEVAQQIVGLLAEGIGILRVAKMCAVSPSTVIAVRDQSKVEIEKEQRQVSRTAMAVAHQSLEAIQEALDDDERRQKVAPRDWAIIAGVAVDKAQLLAGLPTAINLNASMQLPSHEEYNRMVQQMDPGADGAGQKGPAADPAGALAQDVKVVDMVEVNGVMQEVKQ